MSRKVQRILLGKGLDDLPFGATREEVEEVLGKPEETDEVDLGDETSVAWHYWDLGLSLNFDESKGYALNTIEVASPEVLLFDRVLIGTKRDEVKAFLDTKEIGESIDEVHDGLAYEDAGLNLWFNGGELAEIQWGLIEDTEEEEEETAE